MELLGCFSATHNVVFHITLIIISVSTSSTAETQYRTDNYHYSNLTDELFRTKRDEELNEALKKYSPVLKEVGLFIAAHKYLAKDVRFKARELLGERSYFRHFPIPRLKHLHPALIAACTKGAFNCIQTVYETAKQFKEGSRNYKYWPFLNKLHLFSFRTTASYYLCMFTLEMNVILRNIHAPGECLTGFSDTKEAKEAGVTIKDFRKDNIPFQCSQIYYCPDPCYGRKSNGNLKSWFAQKSDKGNPCRALRFNHCEWSTGENTDFDSLIRNRFNITCACHFEKKGFKWSSRFKMCVDRDECHERAVSCGEGKVCQNTKGGHVCVCKRGKRVNWITGQCEDMVLLPQLVNATSRRRVKKKKPSFLRRLEILFGLSSAGATVSSAGWHSIIAFGAIWINLSNY